MAFIVEALVEGVLVDALNNRRARRKWTKRGQVDCAVRTVRGAQPGLTTKWAHGTADVGRGSLTFRGRGGEDIQLIVERLESATTRRPTGRESWSINPALEVVQVHRRRAP